MKILCLLVAQNILQDYLEPFLNYTFSLYWDLIVKSPFLAVIWLMAGQVMGTDTRRVITTALQPGCGNCAPVLQEACLTKFHFTDLTNN